MLRDARTLNDADVLDCDLCIIGGGAAGLTLARDMIASRLRVILMESGGLTADAATQSLYAGNNLGVPYERPQTARSRFLGGSTNCWGGWCRPLDPIDFETRDYMPMSGWPFGRQELQHFYERTHDLIGLGDFDYDPAVWDGVLSASGAGLLPVTGEEVINVISRLTAPARLGVMFRPELEGSDNVTILLNANATEIETDAMGGKIVSVRGATLSGKQFTIKPRYTVLAAGGIENARLLLASNRQQALGLGNGYDLVGRYFMDHPRLAPTRVSMANMARHRRLYDSTMELTQRMIANEGSPVAAHLAPSEEAQRRHRLPNSRSYLTASYYGSMTNAYSALKGVRQVLNGRRKFGIERKDVMAELRRSLPLLVANAPSVALAVLDHKMKFSFKQREFFLETVIEPIPNRDSRVTLSGERDRLGMPTVNIDWRFTAKDKDNFARTHAFIRDEMHRQGLLLTTGTTSEAAQDWPSRVRWCWHHMGTTRMDDNPKEGVVDRDCRVHGIGNLFIAGSSVFPTAGSDTPTMTIIALALRMSEKLKNEMATTVKSSMAAA
ncbi:MAG: GMC family oxidoreductase [Alphaproteobacteria bacterium]|nr:GMC family oxidoreductase [Alphaproteobacteria bacterium]